MDLQGEELFRMPFGLLECTMLTDFNPRDTSLLTLTSNIRLETICLSGVRDGNENIRGSGRMGKRGKMGLKGLKK